jgi:hypothetical protein
MEWYYWLLIVWPILGGIALVLHILRTPAQQENIGMADAWPVVFGPIWLLTEVWQLALGSRAS